MRNLVLSAIFCSLAGVLPAQSVEVRIKEGGQGCGPALRATASIAGAQVNLSLQLQGGFANQFGFFVIGLQKTQLDIPVYGCRMYLVPLVAITVPTNAAGAATLPLSASTAFAGTILAQAASFRLTPNELFATNSLEIEFKH